MSAIFPNVPCFSGHTSAHLLTYSLAITTWWYPPWVVGIYGIFIPTCCHRQLTVMHIWRSSYCRGTLFSHCSLCVTQSEMSTYTSGDVHDSITLCIIPSVPPCLLGSCSASTVFDFSFDLPNSIPCWLLHFPFRQSTPSEITYFVVFLWNWCICFRVFLSGHFRFTRYLPLSFHLPFYSSTGLHTTNCVYALSHLFLFSPSSTCILIILDSIISSGSSSSSGLGSPSPCGHHDRTSGPPFDYPRTCVMSISSSCIHAIQWVTTAPYSLFAGMFSWYTPLLAFACMRNLMQYI